MADSTRTVGAVSSEGSEPWLLFTHQGDRCSFEVLQGHAGIRDRAVGAIGEVILDLNHGKFNRPEARGIGAALAGLCWTRERDEGRIAAGNAVFDALYEYYRRRPR